MSNTNAWGNNVESLQHMERAIKNIERKKEKQSKATNTSSNKEVNRVEGRELEEGQTFQY